MNSNDAVLVMKRVMKGESGVHDGTDDSDVIRMRRRRRR